MADATDDSGSSAERFELLVNSVTDYAIYMLDRTGHVATWNAGARRFEGYEAEEIVAHHFSRFFTPEDRSAGLPLHIHMVRKPYDADAVNMAFATALAQAQGRPPEAVKGYRRRSSA